MPTQCPDTPAGATVNDVGCPSDADADGVLDGIDECPDTPLGASVDAVGCPSGSDSDGVLDGIDQCDTPAGLTVGVDGCAPDGDGVPDELDDCPAEDGRGIETGCPNLLRCAEVQQDALLTQTRWITALADLQASGLANEYVFWNEVKINTELDLAWCLAGKDGPHPKRGPRWDDGFG